MFALFQAELVSYLHMWQEMQNSYVHHMYPMDV